MNDKYQRKFRISSTRLSGWDYGSHGLYFITICTKDRVRYFGEINNSASLEASLIADIAYNNWQQITSFHPYVELDEFVIMPDHIHGILFINKPNKTTWDINKQGGQSQNLASIVRGYKSSVKQYATLNHIDFFWQPRYYDHIIRDRDEHLNIQQYIQDNPVNWLAKLGNIDIPHLI